MTSRFETLMLKLATVTELAQRAEAEPTPEMKQALVRATNDYKESVKQSKEVANTLPGGELSAKEQDEVISMLEKLKERKRQQLLRFSERVLEISRTAESAKMEVDSTASTPFNG